MDHAHPHHPHAHAAHDHHTQHGDDGHGHGHGHGHAHGERHHHGHAHDHARGADRRALTITLLLTLAYLIVEVAMAFWSGSLALLADAGHMLTDAGAIALSLVAAHVAARPRSAKNTYGYRRAEVIGALANASAMLVISVMIVVEAISRVQAPQAIRAQGLVITAVCGLIVNLIAALILARSGSGNLNVRSALLHVAGDALGSLAAIVAGVCIVLFDFTLADPIASLLIALVLIVGSLRVLREAADILMEGTPAGVDPELLTKTILDTPGVAEVHDLHVWCLTPNEPMLTAHVVLTPSSHGTDVARRVGERLRAEHGVGHVTIQPEPPEPDLVTLRTGRKRKP